MVIRKKKCRDCGNAITHNTVCCPYCGSVDPFGYYRNTDRIVTILLALIIVVLLTTVSVSVCNRARYLNQELIVLVRCRKPVIFRVGICVGIR